MPLYIVGHMLTYLLIRPFKIGSMSGPRILTYIRTQFNLIFNFNEFSDKNIH